MTDATEILRLRDRFHRLEKEQWGTHELALANHRELESVREELEQLRERVDALTEADRIAAAVTTALRQDRSRWFNGWRRSAAALASLVLLVPALHDLIGWIP